MRGELDEQGVNNAITDCGLHVNNNFYYNLLGISEEYTAALAAKFRNKASENT